MFDVKNSQKSATLVIFGATGDLARTKLFPALFDLAQKEKLPKDYSIIGFSRREWDDGDFKNFVSEILLKNVKTGNDIFFKKFIESLRYVKGDLCSRDDYERVGDIIAEIDGERGECGDRLLYLAVPPVHYEVVMTGIDKSGLSVPCGGRKGWSRILIEKPFGTDIETARRLEKLLKKLFKEEQIFRIDHYLAKETVQNILTFRFSNTIFEPVWNRKFIESVRIVLLERDRGDTARRGAFYDSLGALRDVGQNHLLQMVALVAMENPGAFDDKGVRKKRSAVFKNLAVKSDGIYARGQYQGYQNELNVSHNSETETYFFAEVGVETDRWRGVPFYIESGKKLDRDEVKISILFKPEAFCLTPPLCNIYHNEINFNIQPQEGIEIKFWLKKPGFKINLESKKFSYSYKDSIENGNAPSAYEKVLFDAIIGDQTLFASSEEIYYSWKLISKIIGRLKREPLVKYEKGGHFDMGKLKK